MNETERLIKAFSEALNARTNPAEDWVQVGQGFLSEAIDHMDWLEKGITEWRAEARRNAQYAEAARAAARVAIGHLQAILRPPATAAEQQRADTAARDWLASIGADE